MVKVLKGARRSFTLQDDAEQPFASNAWLNIVILVIFCLEWFALLSFGGDCDFFQYTSWGDYLSREVDQGLDQVRLNKFPTANIRPLPLSNQFFFLLLVEGDFLHHERSK